MAISEELKQCATIDNLFHFLTKLHPCIGKLGGRSFYITGQLGSISLNDVVKRLNKAYYQKSSEDEKNQKTSEVIQRITILDQEANLLICQ